MFKKIISGVLSVSVMASMAVTALAAKYDVTTVTGWASSNVQYQDGVTDPLGVEIITDDSGMVPSGKGALHVYGTKDLGNYSANAVQNIQALEDGSKYRLTGKINVSRNTWRVRLMFGEKQIIQLGELTKLNGELRLEEWIDVDYTFDYIAANFGNSKDFRIQVAGVGVVYADDLSLKKVITSDNGTTAYGDELLVNGDFEMDFKAPDEAEYVSVASRDSANYIAVKTDYPGVEIYQVESDGTQKKLELSTALSNPTYKLNVYAHTGLTNNKVYNYIVKTVAANGISSEGVATMGMPSSKYNDYIKENNWSYKHNGKNYGTVTFEQGIGYGGSNAMRITNMSDSSSTGDYLYIVTSKLNLEKDKVYKLSFKAKSGERNTRDDSYGIRMSNAYSSLNGIDYSAATKADIRLLTVAGDGHWAEQTGYFKAADIENTIEIRIYRHFENLVLDDFALYEVDSSLNVVHGAVNLFADKNGDFETLDLPEFKVEYKFYSAYADEEQFGEIMDPNGIASLSDLEGYDTDVLYAEATISNELYTAGKDYTFIFAIYKDDSLYDTAIAKSKAEYVPAGSESERVGVAYRVPKLTDADYEVKVFVWDDLDKITPLVSEYGFINEN